MNEVMQHAANCPANKEQNVKKISQKVSFYQIIEQSEQQLFSNWKYFRFKSNFFRENSNTFTDF